MSAWEFVHEALSWFLLSCFYFLGGLGTAAVRRYQVARKNVGGRFSDQQVFEVAVAGVLWLPVGLALVGYAAFSTPRVSPAEKAMTKAQRARKVRLERERIDMTLDVMEHENRQAETAFHRQRLREIEAANSVDDD